MKRYMTMIRRALIVLFVGIALSSCTQNDG